MEMRDQGCGADLAGIAPFRGGHHCERCECEAPVRLRLRAHVLLARDEKSDAEDREHDDRQPPDDGMRQKRQYRAEGQRDCALYKERSERTDDYGNRTMPR